MKETLHKRGHAVRIRCEVQRQTKLMWDGKISGMRLPLTRDTIGKEHKDLAGVVTVLVRVCR